MGKAELVDQAAFSTGVSKAIANKILSEILSVMSHEPSQGKGIILVGVGLFDVSDRKERMGHNPKVGKKMKIPATKVPRFKPGKHLKQAIAGEAGD